jgi:hypothetical protein
MRGDLFPLGEIIPCEKWRQDVRKNKDIVTVFDFSVLSRSVKAHVGPLVSLKDGPRNEYDQERHVQACQIGRKIGRNYPVYGIGSRWPCWMVVVEGDQGSAFYPRLPEYFDRWFDEWAAENEIQIIGDWRRAARRDGVADQRIWREAHAQVRALAEAMGRAV